MQCRAGPIAQPNRRRSLTIYRTPVRATHRTSESRRDVHGTCGRDWCIGARAGALPQVFCDLAVMLADGGRCVSDLAGWPGVAVR